ncbi:MAG TPA: DUF5317 family protein [Actinomycetes bacterium]|jgi:hypothetical protein|nr:DUF5317 family protein [Actinomycetes bacterium]
MGNLLLLVLVGLAGVGAGVLRGGKPRSLPEAKVQARPLALTLLALQAVIGSLALRSVGIPRGVGAVLLFIALIGLLAAARANGQLPGVPLLALGLLANLLVLVLNFGVPVSQDTLTRAGIAVERPLPHRPDAKHVMEGPGTRLALLGDQLSVRPLRTVVSFGDVAELAGLFVLVQALVIGPARREEGSAHGAPRARRVPWSTWAD